MKAILNGTPDTVNSRNSAMQTVISGTSVRNGSNTHLSTSNFIAQLSSESATTNTISTLKVLDSNPFASNLTQHLTPQSKTQLSNYFNVTGARIIENIIDTFIDNNEDISYDSVANRWNVEFTRGELRPQSNTIMGKAKSETMKEVDLLNQYMKILAKPEYQGIAPGIEEFRDLLFNRATETMDARKAAAAINDVQGSGADIEDQVRELLNHPDIQAMELTAEQLRSYLNDQR